MEVLNRVESRADKRELIKKAKKKAEFAKKLTPLQQEYINDVVEAGKEHTRVKCISVFDVTVQGALIEKTDLSYDEICQITYRCGELMRECFNVLENMSMEERIMKVKSFENEVAEKISKMIFEGVKKTDIVKTIRAEYKGTGLTTAEINTYWKKGNEAYNKFMEGQEELKKAIEVKEAIKGNDVEKAIDYIFNEGPEAKEVVEPVKVEEVKESKFKVSNKVVRVVSCDVAGEHGEYDINNGVITIKGTDEAFVNIPAVKNWASEKREALLKEIDRLNALENEVIEVMEEFMA